MDNINAFGQQARKEQRRHEDVEVEVDVVCGRDM